MSATIIPLPGVRLPRPKTRKEKVAKSARRAYRLNLSGSAHARTITSTDPIFKAIATHLDAVIAEMELSDYTGQSIEAEMAEKANTERLSALSSQALKTVLSTAPTTWEGIVSPFLSMWPVMSFLILKAGSVTTSAADMRLSSPATTSASACGSGSAKNFRSALPRPYETWSAARQAPPDHEKARGRGSSPLSDVSPPSDLPRAAYPGGAAVIPWRSRKPKSRSMPYSCRRSAIYAIST
jgi:hypothetical protein